MPFLNLDRLNYRGTIIKKLQLTSQKVMSYWTIMPVSNQFMIKTKTQMCNLEHTQYQPNLWTLWSATNLSTIQAYSTKLIWEDLSLRLKQDSTDHPLPNQVLSINQLSQTQELLLPLTSHQPITGNHLTKMFLIQLLPETESFQEDLLGQSTDKHTHQPDAAIPPRWLSL
jgi:hypothetical protein